MTQPQRSLVLVFLLTVACAAGIGLHASAEDVQDAHAPALAILAARCSECHGADAQESGLRLDSRAGMLKGGEFGPAIVAGKGRESELVRRIMTTSKQMMPPEGDRLTKEEVAEHEADEPKGKKRKGRK